MITVIKRVPSKNELGISIIEVEYNINITDKEIKFHFRSDSTLKMRDYRLDDDYTINLEDNKGKILNIYLKYTNEIKVTSSEIYNLNSIYNVISTYYNNGYFLARVSISDDLSDIVIFLFKPTNYECTDADKNISVDDNTVTTSYLMRKYSNYYNDRSIRYKQKTDIIKTLDIYNTVTYLESQVDTLTRLLKSILDPSSSITEESKSELLDVLNIADSSSVLDIKSIDKIKSELSTDKKLVRDLQVNYYNNKYKSE